MKRILIFFLLCLGVMPVQADFVAGLDAFNSQQYAKAFSEFKPLADAGDFRSQYYTGYLYLSGYGGVSQDNEKALSYLRKSANANYDLAQSLLGFIYSEGKIVPQDKEKALELYNKAAEQNNISAFLNLGVLYYTGDGVEQDVKKAISYFERIPLKEKPIVGRYLGDIYLYDSELLDYHKALEYYTIAAQSGDLGAYHALGYMNQKALGTTQDMDLAQQYYLYAASQNHAPSQYALGAMYANSEIGKGDLIKGYAWISLAANQKLKDAENTIKKIDIRMTLSDIEAARRESIEIQKSIIGKIEKPLKPPEEVVDQETTEEEPIKRRPRRRRRR